MSEKPACAALLFEESVGHLKPSVKPMLRCCRYPLLLQYLTPHDAQVTHSTAAKTDTVAAAPALALAAMEPQRCLHKKRASNGVIYRGGAPIRRTRTKALWLPATQ